MSDTLKILWHSNAPWAPTGYGQQTALWAPRLNERFDLQISSYYGLECAPLVWNGVKVLPGVGGGFGNESLPHHVRRFFGEPRNGLVITLLDVPTLDPELCTRFDLAAWVPIDHDPAPPDVIEFFKRSGALPIAMSRFGQERLIEAFDGVLYVPHAVDPTVLRPVEDARGLIDCGPDDFVVGMVAANKGNPSRKNFVAALQAFARLRRDRENAKLYLHADLKGHIDAGVDLYEVIRALEIPADSLKRPDTYGIYFDPVGPGVMAAVYSAMDVLLAPSAGEGFGVPILEAQACGTPAIVTDFSAMSEVCGAGWKVGYEPWWTRQGSWQALPRVDELHEALEACYQLTSTGRADLARQARAHALQYDVETVMAEHMLPALDAVQERLEERRKPAKLRMRKAA